MRWGHLLLRGAVHLISRLRRQLPLIGEATGVHAVGAGLCSACASNQIRTSGRSRAPPLRGPREKVISIKISTVPSIDGRYSTVTSYKSDTPVSGGAYQDARKVSLVWNARPKHWDLPEFRCSMHPIVTKHSFLPYLFSCERKDRATGGASEMTTTEQAAASDVSFPLCSFLPFQTASQTCGLGFIANLRQPLSLGCAEPASLPLLSLRDISP